ncbi:response regulator transcription factor [Panacibacter sp. DH6]|uniref:Response regulator transcription factor n=1 Tax=Panacibacter microcysteis TaxID=2793269 RepID=A0A931E493_9BACT|nr:response regulator transcription factor [Panacibacter microcysteis]MBG9375261.1 response regulator transcription factor [Panacibacter microcysteis]
MKKVALVDDHALLRSGLASVINSFGEYQVIFEADNGKQFIESIKTKGKPEVVLLDINMPEMDGFATANWLKNNAPDIRVLVLSMLDNDTAIIKMLQSGAKGYILKDSKPDILRNALRDVTEKGFFFNDLVSNKLMHMMSKGPNDSNEMIFLSDKELEFLKWCCTEKSYKEIADVMNITTRAVESLRSNLFDKLGTLSRVGLVMYAIRNGIITL